MALIVGLIDNDEKQTSSKKTQSIPNSTLKCKNHTQFEIKMTKIDQNVFKKPIPFEAVHIYIAHIMEYLSLLGRVKKK